MHDRRIAAVLAIVALATLAGCTHTIPPARFTPMGSARSTAMLKLDTVRYLQQAGVKENEVEFHKAGNVVFARPIADIVREDILKEIEHSGFHLGEGGAVLWVAAFGQKSDYSFARGGLGGVLVLSFSATLLKG